MKITNKKPTHQKDKFYNLSQQLIEIVYYLLIGITPLIVYLKIIPVDQKYLKYWFAPSVFDFFSYYKSVFIISLFFLLLVLGFYSLIKNFELKKSSSTLRSDKLIVFTILYFLFIVISTVFSKYQDIVFLGFYERREGMLVLITYLAFFIILYYKQPNPIFLKRVMLVIGLSALIICVIGIFQFFRFNFFNSELGKYLILPEQYSSLASQLKFPKAKAFSTLYNSNNLAHFTAMLLPIFLIIAIFKKNTKYFIILMSVALILCITLFASRGKGGWFSFTFILVILSSILAYYKDWLLLKRLLFISLCFTAIFLAMSFFSNGLIKSKTNAASPFSPPENSKIIEEDDSFYKKYRHLLTNRVGTWINSLEMSGESVLLGSGPDTFAITYKNHLPESRRTKILVDKPHNIYIQNLINIGGLGLLSFLGIIIIVFYRSFKYLLAKGINNNESIFVLALSLGALGYLLAGMFYDSTVHVSPTFWVVLGLCASLTRPLTQKTVIK